MVIYMIETIIQLAPVLIIALFIYLLYRLRYDCFRLEKGDKNECIRNGK